MKSFEGIFISFALYFYSCLTAELCVLLVKGPI